MMWLLAILMFWTPVASASTASELKACMVRYDVPCAERLIAEIDGDNSTDPDILAVAAEVHFYAGRYPEAYDLLSKAVDLGWDDRFDELPLYQRTLYTTAGWHEEVRGRFKVRWRPGMDAVLIDDAFETLELAEKHIAPIIGGPPPGTTILELYPNVNSFIAASSLMKSDVHTTGTVALSKWSRLLVSSPRTRGRGYGWADTIAHEYIHLVVAYKGNGTNSTAPVWLQEAIAKYLDNRWRDGKDNFRLDLRQQGYLAKALKQDNLVTFEEMHPSLAKLPDPERAALAYAQLASLMDFCFREGGEDVLTRVMPLTREGVDPREALATGAGYDDFDVLVSDWRAYVETLDLEEGDLEELPVILDGGDDLDADPVLAKDEALARYARLGDILMTRDYAEAAIVEYDKAVDASGKPSPYLANQIASANLVIGDNRSARSVLEESLLEYPEFGLTRKTLGGIYEAEGRNEEAVEQFREAVRLQPFDPELQMAMSRLGDSTEKARRQRYLRILNRGGEDVERAVIHDIEGEFELPDYDTAQIKHRKRSEHRDQWVGEAAPNFFGTDIDGKSIFPDKYLGKVVILDFWATWCGPCRQAMPALAQLYKDHKSEGLEIIGFTDEGANKVKPFLAKNPVPYRIAIGAGGVNRRYEVNSLPTAFVVGRDGKIVEVAVGWSAGVHETLEKAVERALSAKAE